MARRAAVLETAGHPLLEHLEQRLLLSSVWEWGLVPVDQPSALLEAAPRLPGPGEGLLVATEGEEPYLYDDNGTNVTIPDYGDWVWSSCYTSGAPGGSTARPSPVCRMIPVALITLPYADCVTRSSSRRKLASSDSVSSRRPRS